MVNTSLPDLEIRIFPRSESGYPIHLHLSDGQDFASNLTADLADWTPTGNPQADGRALFEVLFAAPKLREAWGLARGAKQRRIRLWLDADAPELHALPWELLHDGQTFLAADAATPLSRYLPSDAPWGGLVAERPIRILAVIANPADLAQYNLASLDVATERALLTEALGDLAPKHFDLEILEAPVTLERLERAPASGPHVLHFVGHGTFNTRKQQAALYLQDAAGNTQIVTDAQLCDMLRRQAKLPSLIFLAACQSAERSTVDAFAGLAPKLVQAGVPTVVAMQDRVAIAATRKLTPVFYEELARHGEVDRALNTARSLLLTGQSPDAATPVLLMRLADGKLWEPLWAKTNPYRGLAAFTENDAKFFFGRQSLIDELLRHLRSFPRFLVVVGASGSGKSSVVQAGLIPVLRKGDLLGSQDWPIVTFRPGNDPYANSEWQKANSEWRMANGEWRRDVGRFVLYIDQFEELFALCAATVQRQFLDDLLALIASPAPATVILTVRADFYEYLLHHTLGERIQEAQVNVLPMKPAELRKAIEEPARKVDLRFEAGLVETILQDASASAHALPLLQSALTQLWHKQAQGVLTYAAYQAIDGVAGAISLWADDAYSGLTVQEQFLARRILTRLVHYGEGGAADTRQRQAQADLAAEPGEQNALHLLVKKLADARLVVTSEGETVEIIHDALLREWARLKQWIAEQREFYLWRQRLSAQMQLWRDKSQDESALLRGTLLAEAELWLQERPEGLNSEEKEYILSSQEERERIRRKEQVTQRKRTRVLASMLTALAIFFVPTLFVAANTWMFYRRKNSDWQYTKFVSDSVLSIAILDNVGRTSPARICVGTADVGVGCSYDLQNWNVYQVGFPTSEPALFNNRDSWIGSLTGHTWSTRIRGIEAVAFDAAAPQRIYASVMDQSSLYVSEDYGASWRPIVYEGSSPCVVQPISVRQIAAYGNDLFVLRDSHPLIESQQRGSLCWSQNSGTTWKEVGGPATATGIIHDFFLTHDTQGNLDRIYVASDTGLWQSDIDMDWAWHEMFTLKNISFAQVEVSTDMIYLTTYEQKGGAIYRWNLTQNAFSDKWIEYSGILRSVILNTDPNARFLLWILFDDGKVSAVDRDGHLELKGYRPGWPLATAKTLSVFQPPDEDYVILMGHSDGLLQFTTRKTDDIAE